MSALLEHYRREDPHLQAAGFVKLLTQHAEVVELGEAVRSSPGAKNSGTIHIVRTFLALASHNLIEEERDWFPLL